MNKQTVNDDRLKTMHASALKAYSNVLELKNYSPDTIKNYRNINGDKSMKATIICINVRKENIINI